MSIKIYICIVILIICCNLSQQLLKNNGELQVINWHNEKDDENIAGVTIRNHKPFNVMKYVKQASRITVSIQRKKVHWSTGVVISLFWIMSAAEPFFTLRDVRREITARVGSVNCERGGQVVPVKLFVIHPLYRINSPKYDISLLKVSKALRQKFSSPITISKKSILDQIETAMSFWTSFLKRNLHQTILYDMKNPRPELMIAHITIDPLIVCQEKIKAFDVIDDNILCLVGETNSSAAVGAPVYDSSGLIGIVTSWSPDNRVFLAYNLNDADVLKWIQEVFKTYKPSLRQLRWKIDSGKW